MNLPSVSFYEWKHVGREALRKTVCVSSTLKRNVCPLKINMEVRDATFNITKHENNV